jgi:hypothetical protein
MLRMTSATVSVFLEMVLHIFIQLKISLIGSIGLVNNLQLAVGKTYKCRNGSVRKIIQYNENNKTYSSEGGQCCGVCCIMPNFQLMIDLYI